ncbi:MAG: FkbM family methyltransferase [Chthoniobacterales bacterium]
MSIFQKIKNKLVQLGPKNLITQCALKMHGYLRGYKIIFRDQSIAICKNNQELLISTKNVVFVPFMMDCFDNSFKTINSRNSNNQHILDFSKPGIHSYKSSNIDFLFPGIVEEDSIDGYTAQFKPSEGMVVFDAGAHAGSTTYFLSKMVGECGHVYAFEPDNTNIKYLKENIKNKNLHNVTILDLAFGGESGKELFNMDESMSSSFLKCSAYPKTGITKEVSVVTLEDSCTQLGVIPNFIKMDIEGAEIEVIANSLEFLKKHPIHFAFDSCHKTRDGIMTCHELEKLFRSIGYSVESSDKFGQMFTWATPPNFSC